MGQLSGVIVENGDRMTESNSSREALHELYNQRILALAADIPRIGKLAQPQASATAVSKLCGSRVSVDVIVSEGKVVDFAQQLHACALGRASASIVAHNIIDANINELHAVASAMRKMLREDAPAPAEVLPQEWKDRWRDLEILEPVRAFKARHASTLLVFDAVEDCLYQIENANNETRAEA